MLHAEHLCSEEEQQNVTFLSEPDHQTTVRTPTKDTTDRVFICLSFFMSPTGTGFAHYHQLHRFNAHTHTDTHTYLQFLIKHIFEQLNPESTKFGLGIDSSIVILNSSASFSPISIWRHSFLDDSRFALESLPWLAFQVSNALFKMGDSTQS